MQIRMKTDRLPCPICMRLPTFLFCSPAAISMMEKKFCQKHAASVCNGTDDRYPDGSTACLQPASPAEAAHPFTAKEIRGIAKAGFPQFSVPQREIARILRKFKKAHPDMPLCEITINGAYVVITL